MLLTIFLILQVYYKRFDLQFKEQISLSTSPNKIVLAIRNVLSTDSIKINIIIFPEYTL